ncbi:MAG: DNA cytosine methyltransferase [Gemmatimonadetes bacterium]|nr:DNA cytosine methyltransferase [Gemmatimonadota bacterium]
MSSPSEFTVVSLFAGCGGSSLGYKLAGGRCLLAVEFDANAAETYRLNFPGVPVIERDIATVTAEEVLRLAGLAPGELDVLDGSPPCQGFSTAGKRRFGDPRNSLFREYVRLLEALRPRAFVMENVSGLVKGKMRLVFREIMVALKATGYRVRCKLLNAMWFGVPQSRQRLIWIGARPDLGAEPRFPEPRPMIPLKAVLPDLEGAYLSGPANSRHVVNGRRPAWSADSLPAPTVGATVGGANVIREERGPDISRYAIGREWRNVRPGMNSRRYFNLCKPDPHKPAQSVCAGQGASSTAGLVHPFECRKFTIPELRRIMSFPDDFRLRGSFADRWRVLGNAVPPQFMRAIAETVRGTILSPEVAECAAG